MLALALPTQAFASASMAHCKGAASTAAADPRQMPAHHDHAAMMASMAAEGVQQDMSGMDHSMAGIDHTVKKAPAHTAIKKLFGCECGCNCSGDCAVSCAVMVTALLASALTIEGHVLDLASASPRSQAHAAYRYEPLRPPSVAAL